MNVDELKLWFEKYPQSVKRIVAVCDGKNCDKEREICFRDYRDLCFKCAHNTFDYKERDSIKSTEYWSDQERRDEQSDRRIQFYIDHPEAREEASRISIEQWSHQKNRDDMSRIKLNSEATKQASENMCGGNDIVEHHYIYDESDLSKYTTEMTRSKHTLIHNTMHKEGIIIPHINIKGDING